MKDIKKKEKLKLIYLFFTIRAYLSLLIILTIITILTIPYLLITLIFDKKKIYLPSIRFLIRLFFLLNWIIIDKKVDFNGIKPPEKGERRIYAINHQSLIDGLLLFLLPGNIKFMAKNFYAKIPIFGLVVSYTGNISIKNNKKIDTLDIYYSACEILDNNYPLVIFPEGNINKKGKIGKFRNSAFMLSKEKKSAIIPIVFDTWNALRPGSFLVRDVNFSVKVLNKINYETIKSKSYKEISDLVKYKISKELLNIRKIKSEKNKNYYRNSIIYKKIDDEIKKELLINKKNNFI